MKNKRKINLYVDHLNKNVFPSIDFAKLQNSYETDMNYAKETLTKLHQAMISVYGGTTFQEHEDNDGMILVPGVVRGKESGSVCLALLALDINSAGEH
jgi:hypothetical protein